MSTEFRSRKARRVALIAQRRREGHSWAQIAAELVRLEKVNARVAMRLAHGMSQTEVAEQWNLRFPQDKTRMTFKTISYWENWPQSGHQPSLITLGRLAQIYDCEVRDLIDASVQWQPAQVPSTSAPSIILPSQHETERSSSDPLWLAAEGSSRVPSGDVDEVLALATDPKASYATVRVLQACIADYWQRDDEYGGEAIRPAILGQLRYVLGLLKSSYPEELSRELYGIAAELARLVGWTYFDAQQFASARSYFAESMRLARMTNDHLFMANVLSCLSLQATYEDKPADAAALVQAAEDLVRPHAVPRVMAILKMREAFALAALGDRAACHLALSTAQDLFGQITSDERTPAWVGYFDETKLIVDTGIAHGRLGEHAQAERLITHALQVEDQRHNRPRAFHYFWLATAQLGLGELEHACVTATNALSLSLNLDSARTATHIQDFRTQLAPYRHEKPVQQFERQVQRALTP